MVIQAVGTSPHLSGQFGNRTRPGGAQKRKNLESNRRGYRFPLSPGIDRSPLFAVPFYSVRRLGVHIEQNTRFSTVENILFFQIENPSIYMGQLSFYIPNIADRRKSWQADTIF